VVEALAPFDLRGLERDDGGGAVAGDDDVVAVELAGEGVDEAVGVDLGRVFPVLGEDDGVTLEPGFALGEPVAMAGRFAVGDGGEEAGEEIGEVGVDGEVGFYGRLLEFERVDVDDGLEGGAGEVLPVVADEADVEAAAEDEEKVGVLDGEVPGAVADGAGESGVAGVRFPEEIARVEGGDGGDAEFVERLEEDVVAAAEADAGAGVDDGSFGGADAVEDLGDGGVEAGGVRGDEAVLDGIEAGEFVGVDLRALDVAGNVDQQGPGRPCVAR